MSNYVKNIAIVGAGGNQGRSITEQLVKGGKHNVSAITRKDSKNTIPEGATPKYVDYDDQSSLVEALKGQDVLIITMNVMAPPDSQNKLIEAAAEAGVGIILPNGWGYDFERNPQLAKETFIGESTLAPRRKIEEIGKSTWIGVCCGFWYEFSTGGGKSRYGFDIKNREYIKFDEGNVRISTSSWEITGRAVAALLSLKLKPDDENDKSVTLEDYKNKSCCIESFRISQNEIFESLKRVTNTTDEDWKISQVSSSERYAEGLQMFQSGNREGFAQIMYTRAFFPSDSTVFETLSNEVLGLPKEDLDELTKGAVKFSEVFATY